MKKLIFIAAIIFSCLSIKIANAQVSVSLGINIGSQPDWGPVGYDHADYYYMPDINAYYDVPAHRYVYYENNVWVHRTYLPARYSNYDRYHGYKAVINERNPWERNNVYRERYAGYRGRRDQAIIRESRDDRYRNHWHDNGNHYGQRGDRGGRGRGDEGGDHGDRGHGHDGGDHGDKGHGDKGHGHDQ
ncbi:hypothetical protein [Mucilaginibacter sp. OK098]|uniref:hypothetical protein n=1 Tax=Mucilaginibacter sp. OK098 TaxID=1855297 RepID=UPI00091999EB|nr:hypothetical protein [Mucilaginibacter sp. OK098]SHM68308.1 hypothetical protein SAMN05216524_10340 [Mucilaginibacter sp. OK098]